MARVWICLVVFLCSVDSIKRPRHRFRRSNDKTTRDFLAPVTRNKNPPPFRNKSIPVYIPVTCSSEYAAIENHTMCLDDNPRVVYYGVTEDNKKLIVDKHNYLRSIVQPPATDLVKLTWDDRIAAVAQKWASQCQYGHEHQKLRYVPQIGIVIGQNAAYGYGSWDWAIQGWYNEIKLWKYGVDPSSYLGPNGYMQIGHFTQIVQNATYLVGCGYSMCGSTEYHICNYATWNLNFGTPYTSGDRCSECPLSCVNGLCDCKGVVCYHGGTLDKNTCQCQCKKIYVGQYCEILNCPKKDNWYCGTLIPKPYCTAYGNVAENCPYLCNKC